ncbi:hypothetical protein [Candidatus Nitrosocosmicus franklandus]|uniref:Uncharacterized protein n=1 Tax=Candidatus Nitrosocosmicus franklandianus TaxID=1798806 RepID=A0A484I9G7_9ARCH|nr:hypothetical protein [Candidatus Nitrosocosmicus franklandus]VFJ14370.1 conserved protein of unknown function [Candidatus Nitrosocosmicus franklandus]
MSETSKTSEKNTDLSTLDLGTMEFMKWLISKETDSGNTLIAVKDYFDNKYVILFDKSILKNVIVAYREGMPYCMTCNTDDCGHVGFAICLKQSYDRNGQLDY